MLLLKDMIAIILAVVFGGLIGFERELSGKSAGLRTNVLISLGAALFTLLSQKLLGDDSRIAAGVVTGVGFLGAGAIIQDRGGIHGLTTAATIWLVASVGMACGARRYLLALFVTVLALIILGGFSRLEKYIQRLRKKTSSNSPDN